MSREFNELPDGEQKDVEQDYYDTKGDRDMGEDLEPRPYIGEAVRLVIVGKIVGIEEDVFQKNRTLIKVRMENGDSVTVHDALIEHIPSGNT